MVGLFYRKGAQAPGRLRDCSSEVEQPGKVRTRNPVRGGSIPPRPTSGKQASGDRSSISSPARETRTAHRSRCASPRKGHRKPHCDGGNGWAQDVRPERNWRQILRWGRSTRHHPRVAGPVVSPGRNQDPGRGRRGGLSGGLPPFPDSRASERHGCTASAVEVRVLTFHGQRKR